MKKPSLTILVSSIGTILEWYDFTIFAYLSNDMSRLFFPSSNKYVSLILFYSAFTTSYLIRPLGGFIFGRFGDAFGRKKALAICLFMMSVSTFLIGLTPTYQSIGLFAPIIIITLRAIQGFSVGGEVCGASAFILETYDKNKSYYTSLIWASSGVGILFASLITTLLSLCFSVEQIESYGWRLPFFIGFLTGVAGVFLRRNLQEPKQCLARISVRSSFKPLFAINKKDLLITFSMYALCASITYVVFIHMPTYLHRLYQYDPQLVRINNTLCFAVMLMLVPFFGFLGDKYNSQSLLNKVSLLFLLLSFPLYLLMGVSIKYAIVAQAVMAILSASYQGLITAFVLSRLDVDIRYTFGALGYNLSYTIFGACSLILLSVDMTSNVYSVLPPALLVLSSWLAFVNTRNKI